MFKILLLEKTLVRPLAGLSLQFSVVIFSFFNLFHLFIFTKAK